jgi:hypothetical protein
MEKRIALDASAECDAVVIIVFFCGGWELPSGFYRIRPE